MKDYANPPIVVVSIVSAAISLLFLTGCTETLAPREPYPEPFSMYGLLTPDRDTQFVWLSAIEEIPTLASPKTMEEVTVVSTDLGSGEQRVWEDTVVIRENGQHEFLYRSPFRPEYGARYRIEASRRGSDEQSWSDVRIPPLADVELVEAGRNTVTVEIQGEGIRALTTEVAFRVRYYDWFRGGFAAPDTSIRRIYHGTEQQIEVGWRVDIRLNVDRFWVEAVYSDEILRILYPPSPFLALGETTLYTLVGDAAWDPPEGIFDERILSQPGTLDNVENGTGFVGGGYRIEKTLDIPQEAVEAAQFYYCSRPWDCVFGFWPGDPNG